MAIDPSLEEEAAADGLVTVIVNSYGELCALQKASGVGLPSSEVGHSLNHLPVTDVTRLYNGYGLPHGRPQ